MVVYERRGGFGSPFTTYGTRLGDAPRLGLATFIIHECGWLPQGKDWSFPNVFSPFWRLYHNRAPGCFIWHHGQRFDLTPGYVVIVPEGTPFDCRCDQPAPHLWLHFNPVQSLADFPRKPAVLATAGLLATLPPLVIAAKEAPDTPLQRQQLYHLCAALLHASFAQLPEPIAPEQPERFDALLRFIHSQLTSHLPNRQLARRVAMGESRFIRWFKQHAGVTPAIYIQQARTQHAAQLLALTARSIDEIAADCGFPNRFYFTRVFRRHLGCGPAEYRKRQVR